MQPDKCRNWYYWIRIFPLYQKCWLREGVLDSFTPSPVPDRPEKTSAQWTIWDPWWQEYWVWHGDDEDGYWCDHGWWEFDLDRYSASLEKDQILARVDDVPVYASLTGVLRGIIRDGYEVPKGMKIADIDPRQEQKKNCDTISDKARCIAGSVVEILLSEGVLP